VHKKQIKADEYRRLAGEASALARACGLDNVREKHELAAAQWTSLAEREERVPYAAPSTLELAAVDSLPAEALCAA
jgi:hypothetical protein